MIFPFIVIDNITHLGTKVNSKMTVYAPKPPTLFIHIPKTGGVSIGRWMVANAKGKHIKSGGQHPKHQTPTTRSLKKRYPNVFKFCVVRNPWERLVSLHSYYLRKDHKKYSHFKTFEDFVMNSDLGFGKVPQFRWAKHCELVLRLENIEEDFKQIQERLNSDEPLSHENRSEHTHYTDYYTPEMLDKVASIIEIDAKAYKYEYGR